MPISLPKRKDNISAKDDQIFYILEYNDIYILIYQEKIKMAIQRRSLIPFIPELFTFADSIAFSLRIHVSQQTRIEKR